MKLFEISADITADHKKHVALDMPFHGWFGLSPYLDTPSERVFWVLQRAGVKWILADGSSGGINPLLDPGDVDVYKRQRTARERLKCSSYYTCWHGFLQRRGQEKKLAAF